MNSSLALEYQAAGFYRGRSQAAYWDGRNTQNEPVASGIYFYQIEAGEFSATRRMLIVKQCCTNFRRKRQSRGEFLCGLVAFS